MTLHLRPPRLVYGILDYIADNPDEPPTWLEIVDTFTSRPGARITVTYQTVEATLYDLMAFGALYRKGRPTKSRKPGADKRTLHVTPLGTAWLNQTEMPPPITPPTPKEQNMPDPTATNDSDLTFSQWWNQADDYCANLTGISLSDLADGPSWDAWHDDQTPQEYADELLTAEGWPQ